MVKATDKTDKTDRAATTDTTACTANNRINSKQERQLLPQKHLLLQIQQLVHYV